MHCSKVETYSILLGITKNYHHNVRSTLLCQSTKGIIKATAAIIKKQHIIIICNMMLSGLVDKHIQVHVNTNILKLDTILISVIRKAHNVLILKCSQTWKDRNPCLCFVSCSSFCTATNCKPNSEFCWVAMVSVPHCSASCKRSFSDTLSCCWSWLMCVLSCSLQY